MFSFSCFLWHKPAEVSVSSHYVKGCQGQVTVYGVDRREWPGQWPYAHAALGGCVNSWWLSAFLLINAPVILELGEYWLTQTICPSDECLGSTPGPIKVSQNRTNTTSCESSKVNSVTQFYINIFTNCQKLLNLSLYLYLYIKTVFEVYAFNIFRSLVSSMLCAVTSISHQLTLF